MFSSTGGYLRDGGFWLSVVIVNLVVATALVLLRVPGYRR